MEGGFDAWLEKGYPLLGYGKPEEEEARDELWLICLNAVARSAIIQTDHHLFYL